MRLIALATVAAVSVIFSAAAFAQYYVPKGCTKVSPGNCWTAADCRACCRATASDVSACMERFQCNSRYPKACKK
jgi:hypothetical protein